MNVADTSEKGLEALIVKDLLTLGWLAGNPKHYEREYCIDLAQFTAFLQVTQPELVETFDLGNASPKRHQFLSRLQGEISKRGVIDVLRKGIQHQAHSVDLFYGTPSPDNAKAVERFKQNRFTVTRQLRYSRDETTLSLDLGLFINGLPIATFELKNSLTKQTVEDAVEQYKRDREPREKLFEFGRCITHFAVDDARVQVCTALKGKASWFLPFDKGWNDGAGNPPNPNGLKTDYLWKEVLTPGSLTNILENYAQIVEEQDKKTGKKKWVQIWPRYHQLQVVRKLLAQAPIDGPGKRYLIQHSRGSGKSNSIAWLAHQLVGLRHGATEVFDTIVVVTDRRILDKQLKDTIKQFAQVGATIGHAENSGDLRKFIEEGKKIVISTVQKFPFILNEIGDEHRGRKFAVIIDEAHSSQGSTLSAKLNQVLGPEADDEDAINYLAESRKLPKNASFFAFTATPKNKTLEIFGEPYPEGGVTKHRPFHGYTIKQAIQEGFILDVLQAYTPVQSYYKLVKKVEDDPAFDARRAKKKLGLYVESHDHAIRTKAEIMVDHFHDSVISPQKIGGQARAMVICQGIERAIQYFHAFGDYLKVRKSPYRAIVAFSGEHDYGGNQVTEASLNGFPSNDIADMIQQDPYRFLICADKFQTGYDEPLLHTMYVDKPLSGIRAVQTLSRLNRAHPKKHDVFVLDFQNDVERIQARLRITTARPSSARRRTPTSSTTSRRTSRRGRCTPQQDVDGLVALYLGGADRDKLDPILDACVATYKEHLDEDGQVDFKGKAKAFLRTYSFLATILPFTNREWEKLSIFLTFLVPKLPAPMETDLSKGIIESIDMDSYRVEKKAAVKIQLADQDAEIEPVPTSGGGGVAEPEIDYLSNIIEAFNDQFGKIPWTDKDKIEKVISEEIPAKVAADQKYQNAMKNNDKKTARVEHDAAFKRAVTGLVADHTELFKQFVDNPEFGKWLADTVFRRRISSRPYLTREARPGDSSFGGRTEGGACSFIPGLETRPH